MPGRPIRIFTVLPHLPDKLRSLRELAYNLSWTWNPDSEALFRRIDPDLYEKLDNSPIKLLSATPQTRFEQLEQDDGFLAHLDRVSNKLRDYLAKSTWYTEQYADRAGATNPKPFFAYFSMEFGIHECLPIYSGGLGVLAGDHLKSASDLGVPLAGVSLLFRQGYFRQYLNPEGWQQERYPDTDVFHLPVIPELDADNQPIQVPVPFPGRDVWVRVWRVQVGRVALYLLDANLPRNSPEDRNVTA